MMRVILLLCAFALVSINVSAQTDFRPGFVVLINSDTLKGDIDYRGDELMGKLCRFRSSDNSVREFQPTELKGYRFSNGKYYVSKDLRRDGIFERVFFEYLIGGKVTLYYFRELESGERFFLEKDGTGFVELTYNEKMEFREGKNVIVPSTTHIGLLNFYLKEAPKLQEKIRKVERPNRGQLVNLIQEYHTILDKEKGAIVFQQSIPATQIFIEPLLGSSYYKGANLTTNNSPIGGFNIHVGMPRYNEKLFFRTGIFFSTFHFSEGSEMFYKVPLSLEYMPMKKKVNPRAAYAVNLYSNNISSVAFSLGLNIRVKERLFISIVPEVEFNDKMVLVPRDFLGYNVQAGLNIKLK